MPSAKANSDSGDIMLDIRLAQWKRVALWLMLIALAAAITYFGVRAYLSPELLLGFSGAFSC